VAALTVAALTGTLAEAHTGTGPIGGFESGFTHPIFGFDHLLAMLAVGIWGAQMGGRSVWTLPATFPVIMAFGGLLGMSGFSLPHVELGIALSVLVLGGAIAVGWKPPEWVALGLIAIFAICHGYAHGVELPSAADPGSYAAGFVMATGTIHVAGIGIGLLLLRVGGQWLAQGLGALMSCTGLYFATPLVS
jgi:urease accessory protein